VNKDNRSVQLGRISKMDQMGSTCNQMYSYHVYTGPAFLVLKAYASQSLVLHVSLIEQVNDKSAVRLHSSSVYETDTVAIVFKTRHTLTITATRRNRRLCFVVSGEIEDSPPFFQCLQQGAHVLPRDYAKHHSEAAKNQERTPQS
jgi:hypothetical protein